MTLNIDLSADKAAKFKKRANTVGLSPQELGKKIVELIIDTSDDEFESWLETFEIIADKNFTMRLKKSMHQAESGQLTDWEEAKQELGLS